MYKILDGYDIKESEFSKTFATEKDAIASIQKDFQNSPHSGDKYITKVIKKVSSITAPVETKVEEV